MLTLVLDQTQMFEVSLCLSSVPMTMPLPMPLIDSVFVFRLLREPMQATALRRLLVAMASSGLEFDLLDEWARQAKM